MFLGALPPVGFRPHLLGTLQIILDIHIFPP
jgi:hypothetical protein